MPNHLVMSILCTVLCCLPLGIVGIIHAAKVNGLVAQGDIAGAQAASDEAKKWSKIGFIIGVVVMAPYLAFMVFGLVFASTMPDPQ